jgi:hypothetical protein
MVRSGRGNPRKAWADRLLRRCDNILIAPFQINELAKDGVLVEGQRHVVEHDCRGRFRPVFSETPIGEVVLRLSWMHPRQSSTTEKRCRRPGR